MFPKPALLKFPPRSSAAPPLPLPPEAPFNPPNATPSAPPLEVIVVNPVPEIDEFEPALPVSL